MDCIAPTARARNTAPGCDLKSTYCHSREAYRKYSLKLAPCRARCHAERHTQPSSPAEAPGADPGPPSRQQLVFPRRMKQDQAFHTSFLEGEPSHCLTNQHLAGRGLGRHGRCQSARPRGATLHIRARSHCLSSKYILTKKLREVLHRGGTRTRSSKPAGPRPGTAPAPGAPAPRSGRESAPRSRSSRDETGRRPGRAVYTAVHAGGPHRPSTRRPAPRDAGV